MRCLDGSTSSKSLHVVRLVSFTSGLISTRAISSPNCDALFSNRSTIVISYSLSIVIKRPAVVFCGGCLLIVLTNRKLSKC